MRSAALLLILTACSAPAVLDDTAPDVRSVENAETAAQANGWRKQVIYLVMPDRFRNGDPSNDHRGAPDCLDPQNAQLFHGGDLAGLSDNLDYLQSFGVTAIWTTPLYAQIARQASGRCGYHGYWADYGEPYDRALEPKLGDERDLRTLLTAMHARDMRFILDMVVNHTGDTARLPRERPEWFHDPRSCATLGDATQYCPLDHHPDFDQDNATVAAYLSDAAARWIQDFAIDGVRMDTAKHVPAPYFQNSYFPAVLRANPRLFNVAEVFEPRSTSVYKPYLDAGFDSAFHFRLRSALVDSIAKGGSVNAVADAVQDGIHHLGMERALDLVIMLDNHDVPRFVNEPGPAVSEPEIQRRYLLALTLLFTLPGIPQLYSGGELGMYGGGDPDNRRDLPAWAGDAEARKAPHPGATVVGADIIFNRVKRLASLRTSSPALIDGGYEELWRQTGAEPNVFAFRRGEGDQQLIVVINNGPATTLALRVHRDGVLADLLADGVTERVSIAHGVAAITMPAQSAAMYRILPAW